MVLACGISNYSLSLFHLFNHAFFKALLFLSAGSIIHLLNNEQDIRKMGGLAKLSPFIYVSMLIASLALSGFPFLSGFYSKDLIIESTTAKY
jgi:NADH-ubiquinone oxidoreductase chain 5